MYKITDISQLDLSKKYSYADYLTWKFAERIELIKGYIYKMSPAPNTNHQIISRNIEYSLLQNINNLDTYCQVFNAPFDVRLIKNKGKKDKEINTVVQPDICIVCDKDKLDLRGCLGAPDLIVEIISKSTSKKDYNEKYNLYEENKVKEYWIVNPLAKSIELFYLKNNKYISKEIYCEEDGFKKFNSHIFPDLEIILEEIFKDLI